jgi:hypothetical protein
MNGSMSGVWRVASAAALVVFAAGLGATAATYPLRLTLDAQVKTANANVTSSVTIHVDRLMEESRRARVAEALKRGGYPNFLPALRALPRVGTIAVGSRTVDIKYAREQPDGDGNRLVLVADRPLFFLGGDPAKGHEGYQLTVVDLRFDGRGAVTGTMAGAAKVKPDANSTPVIDDYAEAPVQLTSRASKP